MHCNRRVVARFARLLLAVSTSGALAQGVTGSALTGNVVKEKGGAVAGVNIELKNPATGSTFRTVSSSSGAYFIDNVPAGGPYLLTATAAGFQDSVQQDIVLTLGQRLSRDILMRAELVEEIAVVARADSNADKGRTGPATVRKNAEIVRLPLQGRNFTDLINTDPRVSNGSIAGANNRFNNIQIDGGANNDLFGLAANGTPGGQSFAKPLSLEAVQEFVVQIAPFDVRLGDFTGGLVNAVTKSGTNTFHGGLFGYYQNKSLANQNAYQSIKGVYQNAPDTTFLDYHTLQYGAFLGGPIVKDKLHFFIAADLQDKKQSFGSPFQISGLDPAADQFRSGFTNADAQAFVDILKNKYGISNAGDALAPTQSTPDKNVFVKLTSSALENSHLEASYNFVTASADVLSRSPFNVRVPTAASPGNLNGGYQLSNSGYEQANTTNTGRVKLTTTWDDGKVSNELLGSASFIRDSRELPTPTPLVLVRIPSPNQGGTDAFLAAGGDRFSQANYLNQDIYQVQDNITFGLDKNRLTFGTSNEFFKFKNLFLEAATGVYYFDSLAALSANTPLAFQRQFGITTQQDPGTAAFSVSQLGFYVQDEYAAADNLSLTGGVRVDIPFLSKAVQNPAALASGLAIDTSRVPTGNALWSPRVGFNWDLSGNSSTIFRGGVGLFAGRPPYVWLSNAYGGNGLTHVELDCFGVGTTPAFNPDPKAQPSDCSGGTGTVKPPTNQGEIDYFDPGTKYPQNLRFAFGADQRLPEGILGTFDFLYSEDVNQWYTNDENLVQVGTDGTGRAIYGKFTGVRGLGAVPTRVDPVNLGRAIKVFNKNGGKSTFVTFQLQKPLTRRFGLSVAYTYSRTLDRMSLTSSRAISNFQFAPIDGDLENRNVRPSAFDRPHKITVTGTVALPLGFGVGVSYIGQSGTPYTWTDNGDTNADGINGNDPSFIPANPGQISLANPAQYAALSQFIQSQDCLRAAAGNFIQRGACRNPWVDFFDVRFTWTSPDLKGQRLEAQWDIFNFLNLLNDSWGHFNQVSPFEKPDSGFLTAVGYDASNRRPIYTFTPPGAITRTSYTATSSRWRMQFGARYLF